MWCLVMLMLVVMFSVLVLMCIVRVCMLLCICLSIGLVFCRWVCGSSRRNFLLFQWLQRLYLCSLDFMVWVIFISIWLLLLWFQVLLICLKKFILSIVSMQFWLWCWECLFFFLRCFSSMCWLGRLVSGLWIEVFFSVRLRLCIICWQWLEICVIFFRCCSCLWQCLDSDRFCFCVIDWKLLEIWVMCFSCISCFSDCWCRWVSVWCSGCLWNCGLVSRLLIQVFSLCLWFIVGYLLWVWMVKGKLQFLWNFLVSLVICLLCWLQCQCRLIG